MTVTDANGCIIEGSITVQPTTGIPDASDLPGFNLFPNPTQNELFVTYSIDKHGPVTMDVFDITGRKLFRKNGPSQPGTHTVKIDASTLSPGAYLLIIENIHGKGYMRWIKE